MTLAMPSRTEPAALSVQEVAEDPCCLSDILFCSNCFGKILLFIQKVVLFVGGDCGSEFYAAFVLGGLVVVTSLTSIKARLVPDSHATHSRNVFARTFYEPKRYNSKPPDMGSRPGNITIDKFVLFNYSKTQYRKINIYILSIQLFSTVL